MKSSAAAARDGVAIGELAARFGLATHVLRHWEAEGLLHPYRLPNGRRRYGPEHALRVALILRGKDAGLGLDQLREILAATDGAGRRAVFARHHAALAERIARMEAAKEMIGHALRCTADDITTCPQFQRMLAASVSAGPASSPDVPADCP